MVCASEKALVFSKVLSVLFLWFCVTSYVTCTKIRREILDDSVQRYLTRFGYMRSSPDGAFALRTEQSVLDAVKSMQEFAGLPPTGRLDAETVKLMRTPRCGLPDKDPLRQTSGRRKRFTVHGQRWPYTNLTWSLRSKNMHLNIYEVRLVVSKALDVWARHSKLTFTEVDSDRADILIYFYRNDHGDNFPFDGKGVILAHAFFPNGGRSVDVHFDADENWTTTPNSDEGTNLFNVAAHEFGHSLGLSHSSNEDALMYPWYKEMENGFDFELPDDDKLGIQSLYGSPSGRRQWDAIRPYRPPWIPPTTTTSTTSTTSTTRTTTSTTTTTPKTTHTPRPTHRYHHRPYNPRNPYNKPTYGTGGGTAGKDASTPKKPMHPDKKYHHNNNKGHHNKHEKTSTMSPAYEPPDRRHHHNKEGEKRVPDTCDTSYDAVAVIRREVFFFKDAYFWRIDELGKLMTGYPVEITRLWRELPRNLTNVDSVYERPDGKIVFFIGAKYYLFTANRLDWGYPRPLTDLGLPASLLKIDGAMVWGYNYQTYFYSGSLYWRFDEQVQKVELDYPRDISMWQGVGTDIDAVFQWKDGRTYFFKGSGFWKFNDEYMRVEHQKQKPSAPFWMGCSNNLEGANDVGQKLPYRTYSRAAAGGGAISYSPMAFTLTLVSVATAIIIK